LEDLGSGGEFDFNEIENYAKSDSVSDYNHNVKLSDTADQSEDSL